MKKTPEQKRIMRECLQCMMIPIIANVTALLFDEFLSIFSADILGQFSDAALNLQAGVGMRKILLLVICILINVIVIPVINLFREIVMLKKSLLHDTKVFSRFFDKRLDTAAGVDRGKLQYELEDAPNSMRISTMLIYSDLIMIPFSAAYLLFNTLRINLILTVLLICLSLSKLIVPSVLKKRMAEFDRKSKEYYGMRYSCEMDTMSNAVFLRSYGIAPRMIDRLIRLYEEYHQKNERSFLFHQSLIQQFNMFVDIIMKVVFLLIGAFFVSHGKVTPGQIVSMIVYLNVAQKLLQCYSEAIQQKPLLQNSLERVAVFYQDEEADDGYFVTDFSEIVFKELSMSFDGNAVFSDVSFMVSKGECVCLTGENGSGKSTLLRLLDTELKADSGDIFIDDKPLSSIAPRAFRSLISYAPQQPYIFHGSVMKNIMIGDHDASEQDIMKIADMLGMTELLDKEISSSEELSGGELQKISLARAIIKDPPILILDEPTNHLDSLSRQNLIRFVRNTDKTVILVSHDRELYDFSRTISF